MKGTNISLSLLLVGFLACLSTLALDGLGYVVDGLSIGVSIIQSPASEITHVGSAVIDLAGDGLIGLVDVRGRHLVGLREFFS